MKTGHVYMTENVVRTVGLLFGKTNHARRGIVEKRVARVFWCKIIGKLAPQVTQVKESGFLKPFILLILALFILQRLLFGLCQFNQVCTLEPETLGIDNVIILL